MEKQEYFSLYCSQHTYRWRNLDRKIYKKIKSNGLHNDTEKLCHKLFEKLQ